MDEVSFHPEAEAEYRDAVAWYEARNPLAAAQFEAEVEYALGLIASNPEVYSKYDDEHRFVMLRRFPYSIVYQIEKNMPYVIAVPHAKRRPGYWQERDYDRS